MRRRNSTCRKLKRAAKFAKKNNQPGAFESKFARGFLQRNVETKLARALVSGEVGEGSELTFTIREDELTFNKQPAMAI